MIENEQHQTIKMPEVRKTSGLCDRDHEGSDIPYAAGSRCEADCHLHGMLSKQEVDGQTAQKP